MYIDIDIYSFDAFHPRWKAARAAAAESSEQEKEEEREREKEICLRDGNALMVFYLKIRP